MKGIRKGNYDSYLLFIHLLMYFTLFPYFITCVFVCVCVYEKTRKRK